MQVETRIESAWLQRLKLKYDKFCIQFQLAPLPRGRAAGHPGGRALQAVLLSSQPDSLLRLRRKTHCQHASIEVRFDAASVYGYTVHYEQTVSHGRHCPEVNPEAMAEYKLKGGSKKGGIIANPNCSTIIALMAGSSECYPPRHRNALFTLVS